MADGVAVLLTATVRPAGTVLLARTDPQVRMADYAAALPRWLATRCVASVVFAENSGADLSRLAAIGRRNPATSLHLVTFSEDPASAARGKGHGELGIIEAALRRCAPLSDARLVVKATGRYTVSNLCALLDAVPARDFADVYCNLTQDLTFADSRFFLATPRFLTEYLLPRRDEVDDLAGTYFEHVLARAVHAAMSDGGRWRSLPRRPKVRGVAATTNSAFPRTVVHDVLGEAHAAVKRRLLRSAH